MIGITRGELNREVRIILIGTFLTVITYSARGRFGIAGTPMH
jgi:hypothetical protein